MLIEAETTVQAWSAGDLANPPQPQYFPHLALAAFGEPLVDLYHSAA